MKNFSLWWNDNRALIEKLAKWLRFFPKFQTVLLVIISVIDATIKSNPTAFNDIKINGNNTLA